MAAAVHLLPNMQILHLVVSVGIMNVEVALGNTEYYEKDIDMQIDFGEKCHS